MIRKITSDAIYSGKQTELIFMARWSQNVFFPLTRFYSTFILFSRENKTSNKLKNKGPKHCPAGKTIVL